MKIYHYLRKVTLIFVVFCFSISIVPQNSTKSVLASTNTTPYVLWEGAQLIKGQVGKIDVLKPINLWKREGSKLKYIRVLKPGESYRVYRYDAQFGGQYGLGGNNFITNMKGYIQYKTPSRSKLKLVNPEAYATKLTLGTVTKENEKILAPGVTKTEISIDSKRGKQQIFKVDVDQKASEIVFETTLANDQVIGFESVKGQATRENDDYYYVIAGVNGDYFDKNGAPTDLMVHNGDIITTNTTSKSQRTIFGISPSGKAMIGNPEITLQLDSEGVASHKIDSVNKRRNAENLVLYTPDFASNTMTNNLGTEVVLSNLSGKMNGNGQVNAKVDKIIKGMGSEHLKPGQIILSGHGESSTYLNNLKEGQDVTISMEYDDLNWSHVEQAIGGRYLLVKNGTAQNFTDNGVHPRTAIGIKADGSVFVVAVDGRQSNYSVGLTLNELGKMMKDMGAVDSMTFDGGGSTTMVVQENNGKPEVVNRPSDGVARSVGNGLIIKGKKKLGDLSNIEIFPQQLTIFKGSVLSSVDLVVKGYDSNHVEVFLKDPVKWTSTKGTFSSDGSFKASDTIGKGTLTATVGTITTSIPVNIVDKLDSLKTSEKTIFVEKNKTKRLNVRGLLSGVDVIPDPSIFHYEVSPLIGHVKDGIFYANNNDTSGIIKVSYGSQSVEIKVIVGVPDQLILEDFEATLSNWKASGDKFNEAFVSSEKFYKKNGQQSLKVRYDFIGTKGISGVYATPSAPIDIPFKPVKIGMWVYGDAKGNWLRGQLKDANDVVVQLDFAKSIDWLGWKYVEALVPSGLTTPYQLEVPIRYMQTNDELKNRGQIFIDDIQSIYR
jgi:hypothetical protein